MSILQYVPNSIAMGNGTTELFDSVAFVTKDIQEDGRISHKTVKYPTEMYDDIL